VANQVLRLEMEQKKPDEPPGLPPILLPDHSPAIVSRDSAATVEPRGAKKLGCGSQPGHGSDFRCPRRFPGAHSGSLGRIFPPDAIAAEPATVGFRHPSFSDHEVEEIANLPAQQQAERLLERAINHYDGALDLIGKVPSISGLAQLELQGQLASLA